MSGPGLGAPPSGVTTPAAAYPLVIETGRGHHGEEATPASATQDGHDIGLIAWVLKQSTVRDMVAIEKYRPILHGMTS